MAKDWHVIPLYGVAIQEAQASGDVEAMETVARRAEREGAGDPEIQKALAQLRAEIARLRGQGQGGGQSGGQGSGQGGGYGGDPGPRPLYAAAIQEARASGDVQQMRQVRERARTEGADDPEIQSALRELDTEIERQGGGGGYGGDGGTIRTLYGPAIQQARASGDLQQMRDVARRAETEGAADPEVQSALGDLRAEISRLESSGS